MQSADEATHLYRVLANKARAMGIAVPASHKTLFQPNGATTKYYEELYLNQVNRGDIPKRRSADATCQYCATFHLQNYKHIDKRTDITLGKRLEECFQAFLNEQFAAHRQGLVCERADTDDLHLPDFKIVRKIDLHVLLYFEFKVIFRPFLKIAERVNPLFECYSNSLTLDIENGKKLLEQRIRVERQMGVDNTIYLYWYDLPCVKGIFWLSAQRVYEFMDQQNHYERRNVAGDYRSGKRVAAVSKIYLPLLEMADFHSFFEKIRLKSVEQAIDVGHEPV